MRSLCRLGLLLVAVAVLPGCSSAPVKATGKVVKGGQPAPLSDKGMYQITLISDSDASKTFPVEAKQDGTFTVTGPTGNGVPPGKYKVAIQAMDPYDKRVDKFGNRFTADKTTLTVEIPGSGELVVDVK